MTRTSHSRRVIGVVMPHTSPRLRGEVGARSAPGEGGMPQCRFCKEAPHPNPLSRSRMFPTSTTLIMRARNRVGPISGAGGATRAEATLGPVHFSNAHKGRQLRIRARNFVGVPQLIPDEPVPTTEA